MFGVKELWAMGEPDHGAIIGAVSRLDGKFESFRDEVMRRLGSQDSDLTMLKTAHNVAAGKGAMAKTFYTALAGGLGAGIVKLVEWLNHANGAMPPPGTPGTH